MNLDNTYVVLFGYKIFEPGAIITNLALFGLCTFYFMRLVRFQHDYARHMSWFILFLGGGSLFGAIAHGVHYQLGRDFFDKVFFAMNALSLLAIFYCFRAPYTYYRLEEERPRRYVYLAFAWVLVLLVYSFINGDFILIKIHAGISLLYSLAVHYHAYRQRNERGSRLIVSGITVSFGSILVHSLKWSVHEWFNYKDLAHVIMIISLIMIYQGIKLNLENLSGQELQAERLES